MKFSRLASYFQKLEETSSRNVMVEFLADLLKEATPQEVGPLCYLSQGRVAPLFEPVELGMADKMVLRSIALGLEVELSEVEKTFKSVGDLGITVEKLKAQSASWRTKLKSKAQNLNVTEVFEVLEKVAKAGGAGSQEVKVKLLADLIDQADPLSARYLVRIPVGKLRLGFSDMTVLDALSWMLAASKKLKPEIERAYNIRPDLGLIAALLKEKGVEGLAKVEPQVGVPIMMARAERLNSPAEIIGKIGSCAVEPKIDGFRVAVHKDGRKVRMFSRNMEETTPMYPDLTLGILEQVKAEKAIFEGEAIAYNPQTLEYLPFQETVQRKRKHDIEEMAKAVPLRLICFDCLYVDGKNLLNEGYQKRRETLEKIIKKGETLLINEMEVVEESGRLETIFQEAISRGLEGIVAKRLDGVYQAGARGWNWIKYKRSYQGKLEDTIDAVVMGYDFGQGKRAGFGIGDFLIGVYDKDSDTFKTIAKIGTGLTDEEWRQMKKKCDERQSENKPARYEVDKLMNCDVWVEPEMVVVVRADEISRSPVHTAGRTPETPGFALRFPRLIDYRDDKKPEDATSLQEVEDMYALQFNGRKK